MEAISPKIFLGEIVEVTSDSAFSAVVTIKHMLILLAPFQEGRLSCFFKHKQFAWQLDSTMAHDVQDYKLEKPLDDETKQILGKIANTIRGLSMDAVQKADSGHPGLPMGCAEIGA